MSTVKHTIGLVFNLDLMLRTYLINCDILPANSLPPLFSGKTCFLHSLSSLSVLFVVVVSNFIWKRTKDLYLMVLIPNPPSFFLVVERVITKIEKSQNIPTTSFPIE